MFTADPPRKIDLNSFPRRAHYDYFRSMANPYAGVTVNVDITRFMEKRREEHLPFFLSLLYPVSRAANQVPELRQRILHGDIIEYPWCTSSHTVAKADGTYAYCVLRSDMDFSAFLPIAQQLHEETKRSGTIEEDDSAMGSFFISSVPWINYCALVQPVPSPADSNPRISWGKYMEENGRIRIPMSLLCHHALVDGLHMSRFYEALEAELSAF